jgi:hypothetical protein
METSVLVAVEPRLLGELVAQSARTVGIARVVHFPDGNAHDRPFTAAVVSTALPQGVTAEVVVTLHSGDRSTCSINWPFGAEDVALDGTRGVGEVLARVAEWASHPNRGTVDPIRRLHKPHDLPPSWERR